MASVLNMFVGAFRTSDNSKDMNFFSTVVDVIENPPIANSNPVQRTFEFNDIPRPRIIHQGNNIVFYFGEFTARNIIQIPLRRSCQENTIHADY